MHGCCQVSASPCLLRLPGTYRNVVSDGIERRVKLGQQLQYNMTETGYIEASDMDKGKFWCNGEVDLDVMDLNMKTVSLHPALPNI